jgi:hypothetical protein
MTSIFLSKFQLPCFFKLNKIKGDFMKKVILLFLLVTIFLGMQNANASGAGGTPNNCGSIRLMEVKQQLFFNNEFLSTIPGNFNSGKRRPLTQDEVLKNLAAISLDGTTSGAVIIPEIINPLDVSDAIYIINSLVPFAQGDQVGFVATDESGLLPRSTKEKLKCGDGRKLTFLFKISCDMSMRTLQTDCK